MPGLARPSALAIAVGASTVLPGFLVGALALQIRGDLDVSVNAVAAGVSVFFLAGAFGAGPGGRLAERIGARVAMRAAALVVGVSLLASAALAQSLVVLFAFLAVAGLANSVAQPAINLFIARAVPIARQGLAFGIKQSAIPAAILVSGLALPLLALPLGWRPTFALCGAAALVVAALAREPAGLPDAERSAKLPHRRPSRALVLTAVAAALASSGPCALGAYLVASAVDVGIEEAAAGVLAAAGSGLSLAVRVAVGARADRAGSYGLSPVVVLLTLGSAGFALLAAGAPAAFVAGALVAFALGWGWPGLFNLAVVHRYREAPGAATGVTQIGIYVGAAGGPVLFGALADGLGYSAAWGVAGVTSLLAAGVFAVAANS